MKKHTRVVCFMAACLVGFMGQLAAFGATTNSVWSLTSISTFKLSKINVAQTNPVTAVFLSDGTASLNFGTNDFAATYTNTTKQLTLTPGAGGVAGLASNAVDLVSAAINDPAVVLTIKSVKITSKIKLSKTGVPEKSTDTVSGKGSLTVGTKTKSKSFTVKTLWTNWVLSSGTVF